MQPEKLLPAPAPPRQQRSRDVLQVLAGLATSKHRAMRKARLLAITHNEHLFHNTSVINRGESCPEKLLSNNRGLRSSALSGGCDRGALPPSLFRFLLFFQMKDQGEQWALFIPGEKQGLCDPPGGCGGPLGEAAKDGSVGRWWAGAMPGKRSELGWLGAAVRRSPHNRSHPA